MLRGLETHLHSGGEVISCAAEKVWADQDSIDAELLFDVHRHFRAELSFALLEHSDHLT